MRSAMPFLLLATLSLPAVAGTYTFDVTVTVRQDADNSLFEVDYFSFDLDLSGLELSDSSFVYIADASFRSPYWQELSAINKTGLGVEFSFDTGLVIEQRYYNPPADADPCCRQIQNFISISLFSGEAARFDSCFLDSDGWRVCEYFQHSEGISAFRQNAFQSADEIIPLDESAVVSLLSEGPLLFQASASYVKERERGDEYEILASSSTIGYAGYAVLRQAEVPIPGTLGLFGVGIAGLGLARRRVWTPHQRRA